MTTERAWTAIEGNDVRRLPRRDFLRLLGVSSGATLLGCDREWSVPEHLVELALRGPGIESGASTICGLCESGCGLRVRLVDGLPVGVKGSPDHPLNRGGLCPVGCSALELLYAPERIRGPLVLEASGERRPTTWEEALDRIASRLDALRTAGDGSRMAILSGETGSLFHELAVRFGESIGSPNVSRPSVDRALPFRLTQGLDEIPAFDLARADVVLSFGLDLYEDGPAPVHAISALVGSRASGERCTLLHVGTRLSPSAAKARQYLPVRPGTHGALALGIAHVIVREGRHDRRFVAEHTFGFEDWTDDQGRPHMGFRRLLLERYYPDRVAAICGCEAAAIIHLARRFARGSAPLALSGGEALAGSNATATAVCVHALNALMGAFQRPGGVLLPARVPFLPLDPVADPSLDRSSSLFAPRPGSHRFGADPVEALADGVLSGSHPLDVLLIVGANPVHSSPAGDRLREALSRIPLVVAMTSVLDETSSLAQLILPTPMFLESWRESTTPPTVGFNSVGLGHPVVEPLFDTRTAGDTLLSLAARLGEPVASHLPWERYDTYLEHRLSGLVTSGQGAIARGSFEESWVHFLEERGWRFMTHTSVDELWEDMVRDAGWWSPVRAEADWSRVFATASGRFEFFSQRLLEHERASGVETGSDESCLPHHEPTEPDEAAELTMVCFRPITSRGDLGVVSPMLLEMFGHTVFSGWTTWVELAPSTAHELGVEHGDRVAIRSDRGTIEAEVRVQRGGMPGVAHVPIGLGHDTLNERVGGAGSNPLEIVSTAPDALDGTLAAGPTPVTLHVTRRRRHGGPPPHEGGHT